MKLIGENRATATSIPKAICKSLSSSSSSAIAVHLNRVILANQTVTQTKQILNSNEELHIFYGRLSTAITRLAGSAQEYMRLFSADDDGIFNKLKNYCLLFSVQDSRSQKIHVSLIQEASKAWLLSAQALSILRTLSQQHPTHIANKMLPYIDKMQRCLARLMRLMAKIAVQFQADENVVLFLVRHHKHLDAIISEGFVITLLRKMLRNLKNMREIRQ